MCSVSVITASHERVGEQFGRVADVETDRAQVHRAPWIGRHDQRVDVTTGTTDRFDLAQPDLARELRFERRVGAPGPTAEAVVCGVDESIRGRQHRSYRALCLLHVAEVTGVLYDDFAPGVGERE